MRTASGNCIEEYREGSGNVTREDTSIKLNENDLEEDDVKEKRFELKEHQSDTCSFLRSRLNLSRAFWVSFTWFWRLTRNFSNLSL